ncbi:heme/hemin ABC transporter substrate-binding protein [Halotalea alkalilenta]|uniref:heme/hemin ABC transporter substrate-binding protein n=1 Tax=Halotalea alkalilenta TaxID=376489 RepID=UPI0004809FA1|nr:ABC transporter substrate-binding protein [Halotalea alkalilenta]
MRRLQCRGVAVLLLFGLLGAVRFAWAAADTVVVGGDVAEIVAELGRTEVLVGRDDTGVYPAEIALLPSVGYLRRLSAESVLSLGARRLLVSDAAQPRETLAQLEASGVEVVRIDAGQDFDALERKVRQVATALDAKAQGEGLIARLDEQRARVEGLAPLHSRALFILGHGGAPMVAGRGNSADAAMRLAGLDWRPDFSGYKRVGGEALVALAPEVVLISPIGLEALGGEEALWRMPGIGMTPAGRERRYIEVDEQALLGFGPRTPEAILALHAALAEDEAGR